MFVKDSIQINYKVKASLDYQSLNQEMKSRPAWTAGTKEWSNPHLSYIVMYDWFHKWARWIKSCNLIGYWSRLYQPICILPTQDFLVWSGMKKILFSIKSFFSGFIDLKLKRIFQHSQFITTNLLQLLWWKSCMWATWNWRDARARGREKKTTSQSFTMPCTLLTLPHKMKGLFTGYNQGRNRVNKPYASSDFLLQRL